MTGRGRGWQDVRLERKFGASFKCQAGEFVLYVDGNGESLILGWGWQM